MALKVVFINQMALVTSPITTKTRENASISITLNHDLGMQSLAVSTTILLVFLVFLLQGLKDFSRLHAKYVASMDIWRILANFRILRIMLLKVVKYVGKRITSPNFVISEMQTFNLSRCQLCMLLLHQMFPVLLLNKCGLHDY